MSNGHVYLDEDVPLGLAKFLANGGLTVRTAQTDGMISASDSAHLKHCSETKCPLVTQNQGHFRRLHWLWVALLDWGVVNTYHQGILTIEGGPKPPLPEAWAQAILSFLVTSPNLPGFMYYWRPKEGKWQKVHA